VRIVSGTSRHPRDVPFVSEFWWGTYGLGASNKPAKRTHFGNPLTKALTVRGACCHLASDVEPWNITVQRHSPGGSSYLIMSNSYIKVEEYWRFKIGYHRDKYQFNWDSSRVPAVTTRVPRIWRSNVFDRVCVSCEDCNVWRLDLETSFRYALQVHLQNI